MADRLARFTWPAAFAVRGHIADRRVFATAGAIAGLSIVVKAGTAVRELLVAWYFGTSDPLDAYLISYAVPYFLITLLASSTTTVLVPAYIHLRVQRQPHAAERLVGDAVVLTTLVLAVLTLIVAVWAPVYLPLVGHGFPPDKLALSASLAWILAPTVLTSVLVSMAGGILNAHNRFVAPALSPVVTTVAVVACVLALSENSGVFALAIGLLVGTSIELVFLVALLVREVTPRFGNPLTNAGLGDIGRRFGTTLIGALLMASTLLIDQAMSSGLPAGSVAALNYAIRLVMVPLGLIAAALGTAVLPYFSTLAAESRWPDLQTSIGRYVRLATVMTAPISIGLIVFAAPLTELLLRRGAFTSADVPAVSSSLAAIALEVPAYTAVILLMRVALALRMNAAIAWISAVHLVVNVVLNAWFSSVMGVAGIALSTSAVYVVSCVLLWHTTRRRLVQRVRDQKMNVQPTLESPL